MIASAISARGRTEARATNSSGWWACPPRGPSPSTVSGDRRRHVACVARPAARRRTRRAPPRSVGRGPDEPLGDRLAAVHPRPAADQSPVEVDPVDARRDHLDHRLERLEPLAAQVADELAFGGDDVEGVPGAHDGGHRGQPVAAGRVRARGDQARGLAEREQRVAALLRRRARNAPRRPSRRTRSVAAALRLATTASSPPDRAGRPRSTGRRRSRRSARCGRSRRFATPRRRRRAGRARRSSPGPPRPRA